MPAITKTLANSFYQLLASYLMELGMKISIFDRSVAFANDLILAAHVDDLIAIAETSERLRPLEREFPHRAQLGLPVYQCISALLNARGRLYIFDHSHLISF